MGKILVHEFISVDGVIESPSWTMEFGFDPKMGVAIGELMMGSSNALLLGRRTFEMFAPAWSGRTAEEDPGAPFMNDSPKYVVSSNELGVQWSNSTRLGPYDAAAIRALKDQVDRNIYVSGSAMLVRAMLADGLVDELHLFVYPVALGGGERLFVDDGSKTTFALTKTEAYDNGVVHLAYAPAA